MTEVRKSRSKWWCCKFSHTFYFSMVFKNWICTFFDTKQGNYPRAFDNVAWDHFSYISTVIQNWQKCLILEIKNVLFHFSKNNFWNISVFSPIFRMLYSNNFLRYFLIFKIIKMNFFWLENETKFSRFLNFFFASNKLVSSFRVCLFHL